MKKRQHPFGLFSIIIALIAGLVFAHAAPPASEGSFGPNATVNQLVWTIPENGADYPALLMRADHDGLNIVAYLKQTESQALAKFAPQGYTKAPPDKAAALEKKLQTNLGMRLDVAGKIIAEKEKTPISGARYVIVQKQKTAQAALSPTPPASERPRITAVWISGGESAFTVTEPPVMINDRKFNLAYYKGPENELAVHLQAAHLRQATAEESAKFYKAPGAPAPIASNGKAVVVTKMQMKTASVENAAVPKTGNL